MFSWFSRQVTTPVIPSPPPQPSRITAQNLDTVALLQRIDSKLDILLTKIDSGSAGTHRKKFPTVITTPVETIPITEEPTDEPPQTQGGHGESGAPPNFTKELFQRIEQLRHAKNMGVSHGFL